MKGVASRFLFTDAKTAMNNTVSCDNHLSCKDRKILIQKWGIEGNEFKRNRLNNRDIEDANYQHTKALYFLRRKQAVISDWCIPKRNFCHFISNVIAICSLQRFNLFYWQYIPALSNAKLRKRRHILKCCWREWILHRLSAVHVKCVFYKLNLNRY